MEPNGILIVSNALERLKIAQSFNKIPTLKIVEEFTSVVEANEFLKYNAVDFIAIQPDLSVYDGFDFIAQLSDTVEVLLISKNPKDAFKAYELGLIDCLPPDFKPERLQISLQRLIKKLKEIPKDVAQNQNSLLVRCNLKNEKIALDTIQWIEAMGDYVRIVTTSKKLVVLSSMKEFLQRLPEQQFIRTHKSYIVNVDKVEHFRPSAVEVAGQTIPLSRTRKKEFEKIYLQHQ